MSRQTALVSLALLCTVLAFPAVYFVGIPLGTGLIAAKVFMPVAVFSFFFPSFVLIACSVIFIRTADRV